jgi:hypothetical protein
MVGGRIMAASYYKLTKLRLPEIGAQGRRHPHGAGSEPTRFVIPARSRDI